MNGTWKGLFKQTHQHRKKSKIPSAQFINMISSDKSPFHFKLPLSRLHHKCRTACLSAESWARYTMRVDLFEASTYTQTVKNLCFALATQITSLIWVTATGWVTNVSRWSGVSLREITSPSPPHRQVTSAPPRCISTLDLLPLRSLASLPESYIFESRSSLPPLSCRRWVWSEGRESFTESHFCQKRQSIYLIASDSSDFPLQIIHSLTLFSISLHAHCMNAVEPRSSWNNSKGLCGKLVPWIKSGWTTVNIIGSICFLYLHEGHQK